MAQSDGSIIIDTRIDESGLNNGLNSMKGAVVTGMAAITAAIGAASIAVIALGSEFEMANAAASTLFGDAQVNMSQYQGNMLELSNKTGLAASELGNTMYDALSAGIPASDDMSESLGFLEKNSKLAKAGFTDINTATTATAKVLNSYKMDVAETDKVHKVLMQTQNLGIVTVNELGSVLSNVTPTASAMNVSFEQVGAALSNMTAQGTPAAQATTQLNQLIAELGKSGTIGSEAMMKAAEGTEYAGKSFSQLMKEGVPLNTILDLMSDYALKNNLSMIDMFSSIESGKAALAISGQNSEQFTKNLAAMSTECDVVGEAYDKVTDTFQEKSKKVVNSFKNVGIAAYEKFQEPLKGAMDSAQKSVDSLSKEMSSGKLGESVDKIADGFASLITVATKLASKAIPLIVNGFAFLVDNGEELATILASVAGGMAAFKVTNDYITPTIKSFISAKAAVEAYNVGLVASSLAGQTFNGTLTIGQVAVGVLTGQISLATAAHAAWNAVKLADPIMLVVVAVGTLAAGLAALAIFTDDSSAKLEEQRAVLEEYATEQDKRIEQNKTLQDQYDKQMSADLGQVENTKRLAEELKTLVDANGQVKEGYESRTSFILEQLNTAMGTEYSMIGNMVQGYDELSSSIDNMLVKMRTEAILNTQKKQYEDAVSNMETYTDNVKKAEDNLNTIKQENADKLFELEQKKSEALEMYGDKAAAYYDEDIKAHQDVIDEAQRLYDQENTILQESLAAKSLFEENAILAKEGRDAEIRTRNQADLTTESESILTEYQNRYKSLEIQRDAYLANNNAKSAEQSQKEMDDLVNDGLAKVAQQGINNDEDLNALGGFITAKQAKLNEMYLTDQSTWTEAQKQEAMDLQNSINSNLSTYQGYVDNKVAKAIELTDSLNENSTEEEKAAVIQAREQAYNTLGIYTQNVSDKISKANYLRSEMDNGNKKITQDMVDEAQAQAKKATEEYEKVADNTITALESEKAKAAGIGSNYTSGFINGVKSLSDDVRNAGEWIGGIALQALKDKGVVKSPSRKTRETGGYYGEGFALGIEDKQQDVLDASSTLGELAINAISDVSNDMSNALDDIELIDAFSSQFTSAQIDEILKPLENAVLSSQYQMQASVNGSVQHELLKSAEKNIEQQPLIATLNGVIQSKFILDGREFVAQLAPLISEEIAFKTGR